MKAPFRIAVVTTAYYALSHADVIVSRWLEPRPGDVEWGWPSHAEPRSQIASLFIAPSTHHAADDRHREIGREIAARFGVPVFDSIEAALTLGGDSLAVDGVLLIGEHGDFPHNELGQKLYPRYEYWQRIVAVMRAADRFVPVFLDKHLSYDNERAREMFEVARELGIPLMAGSSLSHCRMQPMVDVEVETALDEVVTLFYGGIEVYGFHVLEVTQALIENRPNGESGIRRVQALSGPEVWEAVDAGLCSPELLEAALGAAQAVEPGDARQNSLAAPARSGVSLPVAFCVEYLDGLRATHLLLHGHLQDFVVAVKDSRGTVRAGRVDAGDATNFYAHFAALNSSIERFFLEGEVSAPLERTLLTTLTINTLMQALSTPGQWLETPQLNCPYQLEKPVRPRWPVRLAVS